MGLANPGVCGCNHIYFLRLRGYAVFLALLIQCMNLYHAPQRVIPILKMFATDYLTRIRIKNPTLTLPACGEGIRI